MTQKTKISILIVGILAIIGVGAVVAREKNEPCISAELKWMRKMELERGPLPETGKISKESLRALEKEAEPCEAAVARQKSFTSEEKAKEREALRLEGEQHRKNLEEAARLEQLNWKPIPDSELGIKAILDPVKGTIYTNRWIGYEPDKPKSPLTYTEVYAGGFGDNPLQGFIEVNTKTGGRIETPTATGPVKIIAEKDGILTLESQKGEYGVYDPDDESRGEVVKTPGGVLYYFDIRNRTFQ
jgi:hypothetical protein